VPSSPLSPLDDYPVHQIAQVIRHVGTSDRNFYDRYYFNMHRRSDDLFCIFGLGQYPNLDVQDGFFCIRRLAPDGSDVHRVVRASRALGGDRLDTTVGPIRIEVLEPLRRLRFVVEETDGIAVDVTWTGSHPALLENPHFMRRHGRVTFDTQRLAQLGQWEGTLSVAGEDFAVTPDEWWGARDRSWGVRPVGEPEHPGITAGEVGTFFWNYAPMRFDGCSILYICQEDRDGSRVLEHGTLAWPFAPDGTARDHEELGRPEHDLHFVSGSRLVDRATVTFPDAPGGPLTMEIEQLFPVYLGIATGYGREPDWGHGMYQGPLVVQTVHLDLASPEAKPRMVGLVDAVGRTTLRAPGRPELDGRVGYGLWEYVIAGPHDRYGFRDLFDPAP
jgi:hypothetical protein